MSSFKGENMQTQYNFSGYSIGVHFHDYKLPKEIDENGHSNRNIDYEIKRQKAIKRELGCKFIRIDSDKNVFYIFWAIYEILRHIKQSTKNTSTNKVSTSTGIRV